LANDTGTSNTDHITSDPSLTGTAEAGAAVTIYAAPAVYAGTSPDPILLATVTADASGTWNYVPSLSDGAHALLAGALDAAGNVAGTSPFFFTLETPPATVALLNDARHQPH